MENETSWETLHQLLLHRPRAGSQGTGLWSQRRWLCQGWNVCGDSNKGQSHLGFSISIFSAEIQQESLWSLENPLRVWGSHTQACWSPWVAVVPVAAVIWALLITFCRHKLSCQVGLKHYPVSTMVLCIPCVSHTVVNYFPQGSTMEKKSWKCAFSCTPSGQPPQSPPWMAFPQNGGVGGRMVLGGWEQLCGCTKPVEQLML